MNARRAPLRSSGSLRLWLTGFAAIVSLCFAARDVGAVDYASVLISDVPHVRQEPDFCGEACAEMFLRKLGVGIDQDGVFDFSGLDPVLGRGCYTRELAVALRRIGFKIGAVWSTVPADAESKPLTEAFAALHADLQARVPSIVCMRYDERPNATEHFRLVLGYDGRRDEVIFNEPAENDGAYRRMPRRAFLSLWPLKYADDRWTLIRFRLEPGTLANGEKRARRLTNADYAQHIYRLRSKLPAGFSIVLERPFVVIGDEPLETVKGRARDTVRWAVERLKRDYFKRDPADVLDIWLFQDTASYEEHTERLFNERPTTPYGFFSPRHRALVMNISTGGGTLVHEIVHPFMAANFPECPSWFNEGLASLYEQSADKEGHIIGLTNWRLAGLQRAIRKQQVPSFDTLCGTSTRQFYDRDPGTNYAQARYLCHYLQERGLLVKYFDEFRTHAAEDPTGYQTLKRILAVDDMDAFQKRWEADVLKLRFND